MHKYKKRMILGVLLSSLVLWFLWQHRSVDVMLKTLSEDYEVGEVIYSEQIEEDVTCVLYIGKSNPKKLFNVLIHRVGCIYYILDVHGPLELIKPTWREKKTSKQLMQVSDYNKTHKKYEGQEYLDNPYVVMAVAIDEAVDKIVFNGRVLTPIKTEEYSVFFGAGDKLEGGCELYDKEGNRLMELREYRRKPLR